MSVFPSSIQELRTALRQAESEQRKVAPLNLSAFRRVTEHHPEDMTATVEAGMTLADFQEVLSVARQWLPLDPPNPENTSIGELVAFNRSGPRRFGYGTVRDSLIGITVMLGDGRIVKSGGKVVKNVAGYDLARLFIGNRNSLAIILEATFKLQPLPEKEIFIQTPALSLDGADALLSKISESELRPVALDLHRSLGEPQLVAGFAGASEDVDYQIRIARELGFSQEGNLGYERDFWKSPPDELQHISVPPSELVKALKSLGSIPVVARAGNGLIYHKGPPPPNPPPVPSGLMSRVKNAFDPKGVLADY